MALNPSHPGSQRLQAAIDGIAKLGAEFGYEFTDEINASKMVGLMTDHAADQDALHDLLEAYKAELVGEHGDAVVVNGKLSVSRILHVKCAAHKLHNAANHVRKFGFPNAYVELTVLGLVGPASVASSLKESTIRFSMLLSVAGV